MLGWSANSIPSRTINHEPAKEWDGGSGSGRSSGRSGLWVDCGWTVLGLSVGGGGGMTTAVRRLRTKLGELAGQGYQGTDVPCFPPCLLVFAAPNNN